MFSELKEKRGVHFGSEQCCQRLYREQGQINKDLMGEQFVCGIQVFVFIFIGSDSKVEETICRKHPSHNLNPGCRSRDSGSWYMGHILSQEIYNQFKLPIQARELLTHHFHV